MDYDPEPDSNTITAKLLLINAEEERPTANSATVENNADETVPPRSLCVDTQGPKTHGHFNPCLRDVWKPHLIEFMRNLSAPRSTRVAEYA